MDIINELNNIKRDINNLDIINNLNNYSDLPFDDSKCKEYNISIHAIKQFISFKNIISTTINSLLSEIEREDMTIETINYMHNSILGYKNNTKKMIDAFKYINSLAC